MAILDNPNGKCNLLRVVSMLPFRKLAYFHGAVGPTWEEPGVGVNVDLSDALADALEEAGTGVLAWEVVQELVEGQTPNLKRTKDLVSSWFNKKDVSKDMNQEGT